MKKLPQLKIKLTKKQVEQIRAVFWDQLYSDYFADKAGFILAEPRVESGVLCVVYLPKERGLAINKLTHKKDVIEINDRLLLKPA